MKHSPAPWKIIRNSEYTEDPEDTKISSVSAADGKTIIFTDSGYFSPKEEDARLVAAAPELLSLCKKLLQIREEEYPEEQWAEYYKPIIEAQELIARLEK